MIISHDQPLDRRIDRFTENHRSCVRIIDNHLDVVDLHTPVKERKEEVQSTIDLGKIKTNAVVQIDNIKVASTEAGTRPMVW